MRFTQITMRRAWAVVGFVALCSLASCGFRFGGNSGPAEVDADIAREQEGSTTLAEAFFNRRNEERIVQVNRYIWRASLDVLTFLPVQ